MSILQALLDGIVQGITEFLPISSSGHLFLISPNDSSENPLMRIIAVHFGTLIGGSWAMRHDIKAKLLTLRSSRLSAQSFLSCLVVATIPVVLVGALAHDFFASLYRIEVVATTTLVFGVLLAVSLSRRHNTREEIKLSHAFYAGLAQVIALVPGTSRSGICLTALMALGYRPATAAKFTVWMGLPVLLGAVVWLLWQWQNQQAPIWLTGHVLAGITAGLCAWAVVRFGLSYLASTKNFVWLWACIGWRILLGGLLFTQIFLA